jgi:hypothetical protein
MRRAGKQGQSILGSRCRISVSSTSFNSRLQPSRPAGASGMDAPMLRPGDISRHPLRA